MPELYHDIKAELDQNLSTDVWKTIFKILIEISPDVCRLMEQHSIVFSPEELMSFETILINYKKGKKN
jgi:hypothetical protein